MRVCDGILCVCVFCSGSVLGGGTYQVKEGACPWHDRGGVWQMGDVPSALLSDATVPQQACGARTATVPPGTRVATLGVSESDLKAIRQLGLAIRETDLRFTIQSPDGKRRVPYRVVVYSDPPERIVFGKKCGAGVIVLKLDDEGITSRALPPPEPEPAAPTKSEEQRRKFHLYLLIGQSNMAGRGKVESQDLSIHPRVLTLDKGNRWVVAVDPIHFDKSIAGVGLGTTFGKIMADRHPNAVIGLIPCAVGGTRVAQWQKDAEATPPWGHLYKNAVARTKAALPDGILKGMLWHQGEGDSSAAGIARYRERLTKLVTDLRRDLDAADVPFVAGELGVWDQEGHAARQRFNENLAAVPDWIANAAVVKSDGISHKGDGTHFSSAALRELGRRYAEALRKLERQ